MCLALTVVNVMRVFFPSQGTRHRQRNGQDHVTSKNPVLQVSNVSWEEATFSQCFDKQQEKMNTLVIYSIFRLSIVPSLSTGDDL